MKASHDDQGRREWLDERGRYHCLDGPALESQTGRKTWFVHGREIYCEASGCWPDGRVDANLFCIGNKVFDGPKIPARRPHGPIRRPHG